MECRLSMRLRSIFVLIASVLATSQHANAADSVVLLVTSIECQMTTISSLDVRKAYLGVRVVYENSPIRAIRLTSDDRLNQIFLQAVVAMSEETYERRLVSQLLKFGRPRPPEFDSIEDLVVALSDTPCSVAYMWNTDFDTQTGLKALKTIWEQN
jgi:hypothetical protein